MTPILQWKTDAGTAANVMIYSNDPQSGQLTGQTSADATITISPSPLSDSPFERTLATAWNDIAGDPLTPSSAPRVEGRVGGFRWFVAGGKDGVQRPSVEVQALEGEVFVVRPLH